MSLFCNLLHASNDSDESNNAAIAAATFVAMTFVVNFPIAWLFIYKIVKEIRWKSSTKLP